MEKLMMELIEELKSFKTDVHRRFDKMAERHGRLEYQLDKLNERVERMEEEIERMANR